MEEEKEEQGSTPHDAIFFVLAYLPLFELFTAARVCRSLRDAVNSDILLWLKIIVDRPLNRRLSDDTLMEVTSKARGRLQALVLINCVNITDDGLSTVIAQNPHITKLHVPGCTSLSPEGIITAATLLTRGSHGLTSLKINGVYGVQQQHLETLQTIISHNQTQHKTDNILYHEYNKYSTLKVIETNHSIDLDICPKCNEVTTVFDCPRLICEQQPKQCRGCASCIIRCTECGICLKEIDQETEEASCGDALCLDCWLKLPKCNFCNKPYCRQHSDQRHTFSDSIIGFICADCNSKYN
ncbi:hypothetical protein ACS0TY_008487 [Phlomoides rotata]